MRSIWQGKWALDSHFLVYVLDRSSPFFSKTKKLFEVLRQNQAQFCLAQQNILEAERVLIGGYKLRKADVLTKITNLLDAFNFRIVSPLPTTIFTYHRLLKSSRKKNFFDFYLAATLLDNRIKKLFSLNVKDFPRIKNLLVVNPFSESRFSKIF